MAAGVLILLVAVVEAVGGPAVPAGWPGLVELLFAVPTTAFLCTRSLKLAGSGGAVQVSFDSAVLVLLGATVAPAPALVTWLLGVALGELLTQGRRWAARAFNLGLAALGGSVLMIAGRAAQTDLGHLGPGALVALLLGTLAYLAVDLVLTALSVAWAEGRPVLATLVDESAPVAGLAVLAVNAVGMLAAVLTVSSAWALALLVPVLGAPVYAARSSAAANLERLRTAGLFDAAAATQAAGDRPALEAAVTQAARRLTASPRAWLRAAPPRGRALGAPVGAGLAPLWLVVDERSAGNAFTARDAAALRVLAALTGEALDRLAVLQDMSRAASSDPLTGLANRREVERALVDAVAAARPAGAATPGLVYLDLDGFKAVNDTYGHGVGDELLVAIAKRLAASVREQDLVARWGGDEFVVLLRDTDAEHAGVTADRLRAAVAGDVALAGAPDTTLRVTASVGLALHRAGGTPQELLAAADAAMYVVKNAGG